MQYKAKLSQLGHELGRGLGLAELGNKADLDQLGLELLLNLSLEDEDFPGWVGWWGKAGNKAKAQLKLGLGLG